MDKKSFFIGFAAGAVVMFVVLLLYGIYMQNSPNAVQNQVKYLDQPVSYENKTETSFEVFQVIGNSALATEASNKIGDHVMFSGNTVLILGENFYTDQVIKVINPQRVGTYSYTNNSGMSMTVPVISGTMK